MLRSILIAVGAVLSALAPAQASACGLPDPNWPCPSVPAPPWFSLLYWDELVFDCAEGSPRCRYVPPGPYEPHHTRIQAARGQPVFTERARRHIQLVRQVSAANDYGGYVFYPGVLLAVPALPFTALAILAASLIRRGFTGGRRRCG